MGSPIKQEPNVEPQSGDSQAADRTAATPPLQQSRPVISPLGPPIYFQQPSRLHPAIRPQYNQFSHRQAPAVKPRAVAATTQQLPGTQSFQHKGLQNNTFQQSPPIHPNQVLSSNARPASFLQRKHQQALNQSNRMLISKSMPPPPLPQTQHGPVYQNPTVRSNMPRQSALQQQHDLVRQRNGHLQPNQAFTPSMTPPGTPQQQYGRVQQQYGLLQQQGQVLPQWQHSIPQQQYGEIRPIQALSANMAFPHGPHQEYMLSQPYDLQLQPNQAQRSNIPPPLILQQQHALPQPQYHQSQPNQMIGSNMLPPPVSHQQHGVPQPQYGAQQQHYPQAQPKTIIKLNLPAPSVPQPQPTPTQAVAPKNPYEFGIEDVVQYGESSPPTLAARLSANRKQSPSRSPPSAS
ncbi:hypothetical protein N431DRAFT_438943 [Stipitochalara longipes BDJ]|nr:hypothetical protein N431DRAFT_438943 [Stipitochalara longipes BDJ]